MWYLHRLLMPFTNSYHLSLVLKVGTQEKSDVGQLGIG